MYLSWLELNLCMHANSTVGKKRTHLNTGERWIDWIIHMMKRNPIFCFRITFFATAKSRCIEHLSLFCERVFMWWEKKTHCLSSCVYVSSPCEYSKTRNSNTISTIKKTKRWQRKKRKTKPFFVCLNPSDISKIICTTAPNDVLYAKPKLSITVSFFLCKQTHYSQVNTNRLKVNPLLLVNMRK